MPLQGCETLLMFHNIMFYAWEDTIIKERQVTIIFTSFEYQTHPENKQ